jgi:hypothetical protein
MDGADSQDYRLQKSAETTSLATATSGKNSQPFKRVSDVISGEGLYLDKIPSALTQQNPKVRPAKADCGIVPSEANTGVPPRGDFERMARRRFQDPKPFRRGEWWCLQSWRDDFRDGKTQRRKTWAKLAPSSMPEREVRKVAAELLRPLNQGWRASGPQPTLPAT